MRDVEKTEISQYANSPTMMRLVRNMNEYIRPDADIDAFFSYVWDVSTAQGFGLNIWGRIVGISRSLLIPSAGSYFGFQTGAEDTFPFGQEPFWDGVDAATQTYLLSDDSYRTLIMAKALSNISSATAPAINQLLRNVFPGLRCYLNDLGNMMIRYTFESILTPLQFAIVTQSGIMLRPAGVDATMIQIALPAFGFSEAGTITAAPFGSAPFISQGATSGIL